MRLLRITQVIEATGKSRASIYAEMKAGDFPKPVPIGPRAVAWSQAEVEDWIARRIKARDRLLAAAD
jgi:prophage regulatory protein